VDISAGSTDQDPARSIHDLTPMEQGGVVAREGLAYQDDVAVSFFLRMLLDDRIAEVWCEVEDDITLIWSTGTSQRVEFIQVKSDEHTWTIHAICHRTPGKVDKGRPASLLERSLSHDRCTESCSFRVVTSWPLDPPLGLLREPLGSVKRDGQDAEFSKLVNAIVAKAQAENAYRSPNGHGPEFWVRSLVWEQAGRPDDVGNTNHRSIDSYLAPNWPYLSIDIRDELCGKLQLRAFEAAKAAFRPDPGKKKVLRGALARDIDEQIGSAASAPSTAPEKALEDRLRDAAVCEDLILGALELRRRYLQRRRSAAFLALRDRDALETKVLSRLHQVYIRWNAGEFPDDPPQFLARCLAVLDDVRTELPTTVAAEDLYGLMYDITARRQHRFTKYQSDELIGGSAAKGGEAA